MLMGNMNNQRGLGLVEVMVSLLLLSVAVLGFSAMQMRAVKATDETLMRSDAMLIVRNIAEDMRLNPDHKSQYITTLTQYSSAATPDEYATAVAGMQINVDYIDCSENSCTGDQQAQYIAKQSMDLAASNQMMLGAMYCPTGTDQDTTDASGNVVTKGVNNKIKPVCVIVSWDKTLPISDAATEGATTIPCISKQGTYNRGSSCVVLETF